MKKLISSSLLLAALAVAFTGCLKDKGFDNHTYGINDPDTQKPGVGFPFGSNARNDFGLDVKATPQSVTGLAVVNLEAGNPAKSSVNVTVSNNTTALLNAYNTANGTAILALPTAIFSFPSPAIIDVGGRYVDLPISISNTTGLDPNKQYAVGLTITAVDGGYNIASNLKDLFIVFSVKNKYDGKYTMVGRFYHPSNDPAFSPHNLTIECHTAGPDDVKVYWPLVAGYNTPLTVNGSPACCFASQTLGLHVNPATNNVLVYNADPTGTVVYDQMTSAPYPVYNPNRWDDTNKKFLLSWGYSLGGGGSFVLGTSRAWIDVLTRTGPR